MGLKSLASKVVNKLRTENLRKYVWYDYSIVEKAKIQIIGSESGLIGSFVPGSPNTRLNLIDELPVQINPSDFTYEHYREPSSIINRLGRGQLAEGFVLHSFSDIERATFDPTLIFDIYDEYNARTSNGALPTDFSLMGEQYTSLPRLINYVNMGDLFARFVWGDICKFGLLAGISVNYTAFSQWGQPLKATATLHMVIEPTVDGAKNLAINGVGGTSTIKNIAKRVATLKNVFR